MSELPWKQVLAAAFALAVAVAGGTFALVTYAKEAEIAAYRLKIEMLDRRAVELERRLADQIPHESPNSSLDEHTTLTPSGDALSIEVISPKDGELVPQFADVRYRVHGVVPKDYKAILVVRDPLGQWWSWGASESGVYYNVQFGLNVDRGQPFEVNVIVTDEEFPRDQPRRSLPRAIESESVSVVRY